MTLAEKIFARLDNLSEGRQAQVLDFVEFLESRSRASGLSEEAEGLEWSQFSLTQAMRGMEDEEEMYSLDDLVS